MRQINFRSAVVRYLLAAAISAVCLLPFVRVLMPGTDEGGLVYGAVRVIQGQLPFRDFFETVGPGTFYLLSLFFKIFGITWQATRIALMLTSVLTATLLYFLARRLRTGMDAIPVVLFFATAFGPLWPTISHHGDSNLFALLSFAIFLSGLERGRTHLLCAAGALAGVTTCFLQPKGFLLFASYLMILWLARKRLASTASSLSSVAIGYSVIVEAVIVWFWLRGGIVDLVYANILWPLAHYGNGNAVHYALGLTEFYWQPWFESFSAVFGTLGGFALATFLIVPFLYVAVLPVALAFFAIRYRRAAFDSVSIPYWVCGISIWVSEIHRKDIMHLVYGSPLLIILSFYLFRKFRPRFESQTMQILSVCTVLLGLINAGTMLTAGTTLETRRGLVRAFQPDPVLQFLMANVRPGEDVFAYPYRPIYYFLADVNNPSRYSAMMYGLHTSAQYTDAVGSLEARKVRYVLWDDTFDEVKGATWALPIGWKLRSHELIMEPYLTTHYRELKRYGEIRILERNDASPTVDSGRR